MNSLLQKDFILTDKPWSLKMRSGVKLQLAAIDYFSDQVLHWLSEKVRKKLTTNLPTGSWTWS